MLKRNYIWGYSNKKSLNTTALSEPCIVLVFMESIRKNNPYSVTQQKENLWSTAFRVYELRRQSIIVQNNEVNNFKYATSE
jgi:hypothetical protein